MEEVIEEEEDSDSNSDSDDGTMMSVTTEEVTGTSIGSLRSDDDESEDGNNSTIDEVLRQAARQAGTQNLGDGDDTEEEIDEDEEVIPSFGWIKKSQPAQSSAPAPAPAPQPAEEDDQTEPGMDMDMTGAVGGILKPNTPQDKPEEDMSMDVTQVYGGILGQQKQPTPENEDNQDATMEMTQAIGGIRPNNEEGFETDNDGNEDMSMELTTVIGGVLGKKRQSLGRRKSVNQANDDATMDMTTGFGRIVIASDAPGDGKGNDEGDATMGMDMTAAIGGILNNDTQEKPRDLSRKIMVEEASKPNSPERAIEAAFSQSSPKRRSPRKSTAPVQNNENDDPGLWAFQGKDLRRSIGPSTLPRDDGFDSRTPSPEKPATPRSIRRSPRKQAPSAGPSRSASRSASRTPSPEKDSSPVRLSPLKKTVTPSPRRASVRTPRLFNASTDKRTPSMVLSPQRRLSGMGADREGLGSPKVAAMFDRRESLGDAATEFVPGKRTVAFQDPGEMSAEVDRERQQEEDKENDRAILEREADGEGTLNLREMIDSLSPKRKPLMGRKSLHVGSAAGVLGKRPLELDDNELSSEEEDGVKRLKGHQGSPVKNVRLQNPPSAFETTGHLMRTSQTSLEQPGSAGTPSLTSPTKKGRETPKNQLRFKNVDDEPTTREVNFNESPTKDAAQLEAEAEEGRIHLQHFLNMTSIRFMELTTTKRRHTAAPSSFKNGNMEEDGEASLERCVVAGACTVPNLELYQHSCRELKKYISEGRRIVKEIETDTLEENPPLFREYMTATPDVKALMDNQFKNVKTHARLLSKAMWYEWRMKLQDGLKEGLINITEGMDSDEQVLQKQQDLLASVMKDVVSRYEALLEESQNLEEAARELADSDPAELQASRNELTEVDSDIEAKKKLIAELRQQYDESEVEVQALSAKKEACLSDIRESERIREECRGWTSAEIDGFKGKLTLTGARPSLTSIERVAAIEKAHGWNVTGINGSDLSMTYRQEIELIFDIAAFQSTQSTSSIDLYPIGDNDTNALLNKEFFVNCIRDHIRALPQSTTSVSEMLRVVSAAWDKARLVFAQTQRVNVTFPTKTTPSESSLCISSALMLPQLQTRVEVDLAVSGVKGEDGLDFAIAPRARVVYGETFKTGKIEEYLTTRIGDKVGSLDEEWWDVLVELRERLIARGRKH